MEGYTMSIRKRLMVGTLLTTVATASIAMAQGEGQQTPMMGPGMMGNTPMGMGMMGPGMMGPNGMMGGGMQGMMGPGMMMGYGPMMQGQLAYLKAELGITDVQTKAWNDYVSAVEARATTLQSMHAAMMQSMQTGSAVDRMEARTQAMQNMVDSMKAIKPATEALYKALTDEQKKKADLLLGNGCCMM
jgi:hypothetical protein